MRIITGTAKGKRLFAPEGRDVRPTPERVKEGIFSALQFDIEGRRVLDLFAGSGQLGLEALSRGADSCTFVDMSETSLALVRKNLEGTGLSNKARVARIMRRLPPPAAIRLILRFLIRPTPQGC